MQLPIKLILAKVFAKFKFKHPAVAAGIVTFLSAAVATVDSGSLFGLIHVGGVLQEVIKYLGIGLLGLSGSETYQYINMTQKSN
jgi:hypothetical protein